MDDMTVIELYFARDRDAIKETDKKYGRLCHSIASNILGNQEDAEECVNDTYLCLWNLIPPTRPSNFTAFICKITRNLSLKRLEYNHAQKRTPNITVSFDELSEVLSDEKLSPYIESEDIGRRISEFLRTKSPTVRKVFIRKYWFFDTVEEIAKTYAFSESKVKSMLYRTRNELREHLRKEGIAI